MCKQSRGCSKGRGAGAAAFRATVATSCSPVSRLHARVRGKTFLSIFPKTTLLATMEVMVVTVIVILLNEFTPITTSWWRLPAMLSAIRSPGTISGTFVAKSVANSSTRSDRIRLGPASLMAVGASAAATGLQSSPSSARSSSGRGYVTILDDMGEDEGDDEDEGKAAASSDATVLSTRQCVGDSEWYEINTDEECTYRELKHAIIGTFKQHAAYTRFRCPTTLKYSSMVPKDDLTVDKNSCAELVVFTDDECKDLNYMATFVCGSCTKIGVGGDYMLPFCEPITQNLTMMTDCNSDCSICWGAVNPYSFPYSYCVNETLTNESKGGLETLNAGSIYNQGIADCKVLELETFTDSTCTVSNGSLYMMQYACGPTGNYSICSNAELVNEEASLLTKPVILVHYCSLLSVYSSGTDGSTVSNPDTRIGFYIDDGSCYPRNDGTSALVECGVGETYCAQFFQYHNSHDCSDGFSMMYVRACDTCFHDDQAGNGAQDKFAFITNCNLENQSLTIYRNCLAGCDLSTCDSPSTVHFEGDCIPSPFNASNYGLRFWGLKPCRYTQVTLFSDEQCSPSAFQERFIMPERQCDGYAYYMCLNSYPDVLLGTCRNDGFPLEYGVSELCFPLLPTQTNSPFRHLIEDNSFNSSFPLSLYVYCHDFATVNTTAAAVCVQVGECAADDDTCSTLTARHSVLCNSCVGQPSAGRGLLIGCDSATGSTTFTICDATCENLCNVSGQVEIPIGESRMVGSNRFRNGGAAPCDPVRVLEYDNADCSGDPFFTYSLQSGTCTSEFFLSCNGGAVSSLDGIVVTYSECSDSTCSKNCTTHTYPQNGCISYFPSDEPGSDGLYSKVTCDTKPSTCAQIAMYEGSDCTGSLTTYGAYECDSCTRNYELNVFQSVRCDGSTLNISQYCDPGCTHCARPNFVIAPLQNCFALGDDTQSIFFYTLADCAIVTKKTYAKSDCSEEHFVNETRFAQGLCQDGVTMACTNMALPPLPSQSTTLSGGAIFGIVFAGAIVISGAIVGVILYRRHRQQQAAIKAAEAADWEKVLVRM